MLIRREYAPTKSPTSLTLGQRVELSLDGDQPQAAELSKYVGPSCYATVVRTMAVQSSGGSLIGAGLRFDQPLAFWDH